MQLFVGLGNPGAKYARNRHNIGFMAVDAIADANGFGPWRRKFQAEIAEGRLGSQKVLLVKPQTFMNLSGQAVGEAMRYLKVSAQDIWVFHDELDLAPGKLKVKQGGGHAGHNGLRSLHQHIGADYHRIRLGIGHPGHKDLVSGYVLHDFAQADQEWLDPLLSEVGRQARRLADGDPPGFMNAIALALRPPERSAKQTQKKPGEPNQPVPPSTEGPDPEGALARLIARFSRK